MNKLILGAVLSLAIFSTANAAEFVIDGTGAGMHTSVNFKASHMGISSLWGRFNDIKGHFNYDPANIGASTIAVEINPASLDTNHKDRDTHLKSADYLDVTKFPEAGFVSTAIVDKGDGKMGVTGDFTLRGVTKEITFDVVRTGEGDSPFGDYRAGFEGEAVIDAADYGLSITPKSQLNLWFAIEGVRQ
ncbi:MAG: YceI family protein [Pseudomonadota bacterium]